MLYVRLSGLWHLCLFLMLFLACSDKPQGAYTSEVTSRPNILLLLVDDLGKEWISCYGAEDIQTPNIDALAAGGTMFHNVYSMPQCTPTRVTLLTGQYPYRHGWVNHWDVPRWGGGAHFDVKINPSLALEMKKAGYRTCIAGKWQIDDFRVEPDALQRNGFDEYCMWTGYESGIPASAERYYNPYIFRESGSKTDSGSFGPDVFKNYVIDFISDNKDKPMFIFYPMVLTHPPLVNTLGDTADSAIGKHKSMVRYMDKITGEIIDALKSNGILNKTVVFWTTDNGTSKGIKGTYRGKTVEGGKGETREPGICAPFIVSWPGVVRKNFQSDALIDFTDLFPTCLDLAGVPPAQQIQMDEHAHLIDGKSFKNVLINKSNDTQRTWILSMGGGNNARRTEAGVENEYRFRDRVLRNK